MDASRATGDAALHAAVRRVSAGADGQDVPDVLDLLARRLPGTDLTSLLLEVFRRRASAMTGPDVLRRYRADRFVAPGAVGFAALRRAEDALLGALPPHFDVVTLAPVVPLGTHAAPAGVDPRNVIATIRGTEVAADPTNGLALEAGVRRQALLDAAARSAEPVRLAAIQRVTRAQFVSGPVSFAHFSLFGMITAGRDTGSRAFEREHLPEHLRFAAQSLAALGAGPVRIALTCLDDVFGDVAAAARHELAGQPGIAVTDAPERQSGRAYYRGLCFKVFAGEGDAELEVGDGGFVAWTAALLGNRKERLLISGYGLDRLAILAVSPGP